MWFEDIYVKFNNKLEINTIYSYTIIMKIFINKYIKGNINNYSDKKLLINDAILYSKYYLYYKIFNCIYDDFIMNIIYNTDHNLFNLITI
jgi:hypothetical protein